MRSSIEVVGRQQGVGVDEVHPQRRPSRSRRAPSRSAAGPARGCGRPGRTGAPRRPDATATTGPGTDWNRGRPCGAVGSGSPRRRRNRRRPPPRWPGTSSDTAATLVIRPGTAIRSARSAAAHASATSPRRAADHRLAGQPGCQPLRLAGLLGQAGALLGQRHGGRPLAPPQPGPRLHDDRPGQHLKPPLGPEPRPRIGAERVGQLEVADAGRGVAQALEGHRVQVGGRPRACRIGGDRRERCRSGRRRPA